MNVLIVSPHMDDETLGAGGTLSRYAAEGHDVYWINVANTRREYGFDEEIVQRRELQKQKVIETYPITKAFDLKLEPAQLGEYSDGKIISELKNIIEEVRPEVMILPYSKDIHSDHGQVFRWCKPFTKAFRYKFIKKILVMEVLSETDFVLPEETFAPNYFVDISDYIEKKIEIMRLYEQELGQHPFPRNIENIRALARLRGAVAGVEYAESFKVLRYIDK